VFNFISRVFGRNRRIERRVQQIKSEAELRELARQEDNARREARRLEADLKKLRVNMTETI
jgi:predicted  nucleic acid-binding Zn-ribbon protein